jgi:hydroxyacylglutathione hydrolase
LPSGKPTAFPARAALLTVDPFICHTDNYAVLLHDEESGETAVVDTPDADAILARLRRHGWQLGSILTTHHHADHTAGNIALKQATGCSVTGPAAEAGRIPGLDRGVREGDAVFVGTARFEVIETPGHTAGHIAYWCAEEKLAFVGDTLFSLGCGRLFEGTAATMWESLARLARLPRETQIHCGHEYTEANGRFAITVEPNNLDLQARIAEVAELRARGKMTLPTTIGQELATNPFLRADRPRLKAAIGMKRATPDEVFAELRRRKDIFP